MRHHAVAPIALVTAVLAGTSALGPAQTARAAAVTAVLVAEHSTSVWGVPSPDPAGITYDPVNDRLVISDSEVDEMPLYAGTNVFFATRGGVQDAARPGWSTLPWSDEAAGVSYQNAGRVFISDDDADRVFMVDTGPDGMPVGGTPQSFSVRPLQGDPEDVTIDMDSAGGHLVVIDGHDNNVYDYGPGPNGKFDGVPGAGGDDTLVTFDVGQYGALDPEGIEYHPGRNTLLVLDSGSKSVYEIDRLGALVNVVSIAAAGPKSAAGMTLAPASDGSGAQNVYIVDRGVDNDTNPAENDGRFYEMALNLPPLGDAPRNTAPSVSAGPDLTATLPGTASLNGSVTDDGRPAGSVVVAGWTAAEGPGAVTFSPPDQARTTASFSEPGSYVLRLSGSDGELTTSDDVSVVVGDGVSGTLAVPVRFGADDAEERSGSTSISGTDLELVVDGPTAQTVGLRFTGIAVPQGAVISKAHLQFTTDEPTSAPTSLVVAGQAADDTAAFTTAAGDVSSRPRTSAQVAWEPAPWAATGGAGIEQRTPDLAPVLQEIVDRPGWVRGNAMTLVVTGTGTRTADAYEGGAAKAPVLHLEFGPPPAGEEEPPNQPPTVSAGPDVAVVGSDPATLAGSVEDDGLPAGSTLSAAWTQVSGPGTATIAEPNQPSTTATFSAPGDYVLRLTASDGGFEVTDEVAVAVTEAAAPVEPIPSGVVDVPVRTGVDDAEERSGGTAIGSGDLELGQDGSRRQTVGLRFAGVPVPAGATVTRAYVQFQADEVGTAAADLLIAGQAADDPVSFSTSAGDVSSRPRTAATVRWAPSGWSDRGSRGPEQRTPDLTAVVQEIVSRPGWASGNALVLVVDGTGTRTAEAYEGGASKAPVLHVEYGGTGTGGTAPDGGAAEEMTLSVPVRAGVDDAEERPGRTAGLGSGDLNLGQDGSRQQVVGLRFADVALPPGATVTGAYVQFQADEPDTAAATLSVAGQAADDPLSFQSTVGNISSRPLTGAAVAWSPEPWTTAGLRGPDQRTPDLASVVREIVSRPGWVSGNALVLVITGTGSRTAEAYDGGAAKAPVLHIRYTLP